jgi:hypothetical protein
VTGSLHGADSQFALTPQIFSTMSRGETHILRSRQSTDFRDNQSSCGYIVLCSHYCLVDEIIHSFPAKGDIVSCKYQNIRAVLLGLKKLNRTIANAEIGAISHDASAEIEMVVGTIIILQSLFIKYFAFVEHCYGHRSLDPTQANHFCPPIGLLPIRGR